MNGQSHMTRILLISRDIVDYYFLLQFVQLTPYQFVFLSLLNFGECISFYCSVTYYHELSSLNNTPLKLSVLHDRCWDMASLASALQVSKAEIKVSVKLSFCLETLKKNQLSSSLKLLAEFSVGFLLGCQPATISAFKECLLLPNWQCSLKNSMRSLMLESLYSCKDQVLLRDHLIGSIQDDFPS